MSTTASSVLPMDQVKRIVEECCAERLAEVVATGGATPHLSISHETISRKEMAMDDGGLPALLKAAVRRQPECARVTTTRDPNALLAERVETVSADAAALRRAITAVLSDLEETGAHVLLDQMIEAFLDGIEECDSSEHRDSCSSPTAEKPLPATTSILVNRTMASRIVEACCAARLRASGLHFGIADLKPENGLTPDELAMPDGALPAILCATAQHGPGQMRVDLCADPNALLGVKVQKVEAEITFFSRAVQAVIDALPESDGRIDLENLFATPVTSDVAGMQRETPITAPTPAPQRNPIDWSAITASVC